MNVDKNGILKFDDGAAEIAGDSILAAQDWFGDGSAAIGAGGGGGFHFFDGGLVQRDGAIIVKFMRFGGFDHDRPCVAVLAVDVEQ
jgi:hypothetical protein